MVTTGRIDELRVAGLQCGDIIKMLSDSARIALAGQILVPLIVIVEDHRNHVIEIRDEPVL